MNIERKRVAFVEIVVPEIKAGGEPKEMRFKGYGAVFGNVDATAM
jgi:hypothetical protein